MRNYLFWQVYCIEVYQPRRSGLFPSEVANNTITIGTDHLVKINGIAYTWHHHQDTKHMQLVKASIHKGIGYHIGGRKLAETNHQGIFPSPTISALLTVINEN